MSGQPGLFLDRDGVINHYLVDSVRSLDQFSYYPFTAEAMKTLGQLGWPMVVVTNQSAIGRGWTDSCPEAKERLRMYPSGLLEEKILGTQR